MNKLKKLFFNFSLFIWCYLSLLFLIFLFLNFKTPLWADDLCRFGFDWIWSFKVAFHEYLNWTGRIFVIFVTQTFLKNQILISLFNILNSLVFPYFVLIIFMCSSLRLPNKKTDLIDLILITALVITFSNGFAEVALWKTGAIAYMWPMAAELTILYFYIKNNRECQSGTVFKYAFPLLCFVTATSLELVSIPVSLFLLFYVIFNILSKNRISETMFIGSLLHLIGTLVLIIAPGNYERLDALNIQTPFMLRVMDTIIAFKNFVIEGGWIFAILLALTINSLLVIQNNSKIQIQISNNTFGVLDFKKTTSRVFLFLSLSIISALTMSSTSQIFVGRVVFPIETFLILSIAALIANRQFNLFSEAIIGSLSLLGIGLAFYFIFPSTLAISKQETYRNYLITTYKDNDAKVWTLPKFFLPHTGYGEPKFGALKWIFMRDISEDINGWVNICFLRGHLAKEGIKTVATPSPVFLDTDIILETNNSHIPHTRVSNGILYYQYNESCSKVPNHNPFFLHIHPSDPKSLPRQNRSTGIHNLDFWFNPADIGWVAKVLNKNGNPVNNSCIIYKRLPNYSIDKIDTGQFDIKGHLWRTTIKID